ncbi:hypothetical protein FSP39_021748 [Pinctada imbricata]|uniref:Myotrophin n=1 Tax=Pinctada imbricata TaxID=66713 RepID=A0AA89C2P8_PINIB|nr:hypothetical protein FSP39_021748 [Pinctada imbricata]
MSELKWGIQNGDLDTVKNLVQKDEKIVNNETEGGRFPLHIAADYGQTEVIEFLINKGAEVNKADKHGITPLLAAVWENHTSSVKLLLEKGADKNVQSPDGTAVIDCAEKDEIKKLLS